ncbi:NAD(P)/FAD-dependent oxidoreductase [Roseobacteraceae bacterium S113]
MQRLYEPFAYSDAPLERCLWNDVPALPGNAPVQGTRSVDVAIIGGGYTGLSAALHLAEAGEEVCVLDAQRIGWGASGRSGGFCCLGGGKISNAALTRRFGPQERASYRRAEVEAVGFVDDLTQRLALKVERHSEGETLLAHTPRHWRALKAEAGEVEADYGVTPDLIAQDALRQHGMGGPFFGAMTIPIGFALNPRAYVQGLARAAQEAGALLYDASPVSAIAQNAHGFALTTPAGRVTARRIILATNGYSSDDVPDWLRARYVPLQSNVLATRPLTPDERAAQGWTTGQMAYDTRHLLHYFRLMPDGRFLFGMRGGVYATKRGNGALKAKIHANFRAMFPAWAGVEIPYFWSGLVCLARNRLPFVGAIPEMPGAFAGLAYHGNGIAMGSYAGRLLADLVRDRAPEHLYPAALQAPPRRFPLGRYRRVLLQGINAVYGLADR